MGSNGVVMQSPLFDYDLRFLQAVEDLIVEKLVAKARVEALDIAIFPG